MRSTVFRSRSRPDGWRLEVPVPLLAAAFLMGVVAPLSAQEPGNPPPEPPGAAAPGAASAETLSAEVLRLVEAQNLYRGACATCHGRLGKGDGPGARMLNPKPRDFTAKLSPDKVLVRTIRGGSPMTAMPAWGKILSDGEIAGLVDYVKILSGRAQEQGPNQPAAPPAARDQEPSSDR